MKGIETMIVKVQLSLFTTRERSEALIYNEDRSFSIILPESACPGLREVLDGTMKAYFEAYVTSTGKLELLKRAPEQEW